MAAPVRSTDRAPARGGDGLSWAILIFLAIIWGGSFSFTSVAVQDLEPITVVAARLLLGALIVTPLAFVIAGGLPSPRGVDGRLVWGIALAGAVFSNAGPFMLLAWAQKGHVESGLAAIFMATTPLVVLPLAALFVPGERMTLSKSIGFLIGFIGVAVLIGVDALSGLGGGWIEILAQLACVAAATGYAIGSVMLKRAPASHPIAFSALTLIFGALIAVPVALLVESPFDAVWTTDSVLALVYLGALPTGLAMMLLLVVIRRRGPTFLALVNYQVPVWGLVFGVLFLGETAPAIAPLALLIILIGVAISQGAHRALFDRLAQRG